MRLPLPRLVGVFLALAALAHGEAASKPNIIFILADDLGYTDLACYGSKYYETPNIDHLASQGMRFTDGYTGGPNSQPTRAALLTGEYGPRTGIYTVGGADLEEWQSRPLRPVENASTLPDAKITIAQALKNAGYTTAIFGKWRFGDQGHAQPAYHGFDEAIVSVGGHYNFKTEPPLAHPKDAYLADFLTDRAVDFIRRSKDKPFFLYLSHGGVHAPLEAKPELIDHFRAKTPSDGQCDPVYAAMIASIDESVGRIMTSLEELGLAQNTLIIFSSVNGGVGGYAREGVLKEPDLTDNSPLRGGKGMLYEGGVRVPYIVSWPGQIDPGTTCDTPITSVDLYPTLLEAAGSPAPSHYALDGVSFLPLLTHAGKGEMKRDAIYWHFPEYLAAGEHTWRATPGGAIRMGDWKLLEFFEDNRVELYNLRDDIGERHNLATEQPERAHELRKRLVEWRKEIGAKMPSRNTERQRTVESRFSKQELLQ